MAVAVHRAKAADQRVASAPAVLGDAGFEVDANAGRRIPERQVRRTPPLRGDDALEGVVARAADGAVPGMRRMTSLPSSPKMVVPLVALAVGLGVAVVARWSG
jgi:hypothetical protein